MRTITRHRDAVRASLVLGALTAVLVGCSAREDVAPVPPDSWDDAITLREPTDRDPSPNVLEIDLHAYVAEIEVLPGKKSKMWTYDGGVPGPLIKAKVGDTLIVHFKNDLPEPTTIHWHGLRIPEAMDGNGMSAVPSGGTFEYRFTLPDAGTFWYHPHHHSAAQVGYGLYGPLIVEDPAAPNLGATTDIILSDASIEDDGRLLPSTTGGPIADLFGREGSLLLVNGKLRPTLHARAGAPLHLRMINASRSRYYRMALDNHDVIIVGGDGGLRERPARASEVMIVPGERIELVIVPRGARGSKHTLKWIPYERGFGTAFARVPEPILDLQIDDLAEATPPAPPDRLRTIAPLDTTGAITQHVELTQTTEGMVTFLGINGVPFDKTVPLRATVGDTNIWEVVNKTEAHHPFHLHGFFFQVIGEGTEWKDTLNIPAKETRKLVVRYDDRPGMWMFHCHILDHAELGMMGMLDLVRSGTAAHSATH